MALKVTRVPALEWQQSEPDQSHKFNLGMSVAGNGRDVWKAPGGNLLLWCL